MWQTRACGFFASLQEKANWNFKKQATICTTSLHARLDKATFIIPARALKTSAVVSNWLARVGGAARLIIRCWSTKTTLVIVQPTSLQQLNKPAGRVIQICKWRHAAFNEKKKRRWIVLTISGIVTHIVSDLLGKHWRWAGGAEGGWGDWTLGI